MFELTSFLIHTVGFPSISFFTSISDNDKKLQTFGFEQHAEILCKVVRKGNIFYEIPISYNGRTSDEGKKIKFYHFFTIVLRILIERIKK